MDFSTSAGPLKPVPTRLALCPPHQVDACTSQLNSSDVFLLVSSSGSWMWKGRGSSSAEAKGAEYLAGVLQVTPTQLEEGNEEGGSNPRVHQDHLIGQGPQNFKGCLSLITGAFWVRLGGQKDYCRFPRLNNKMDAHPPRLFACSNKTGTFKVCLIT